MVCRTQSLLPHKFLTRPSTTFRADVCMVQRTWASCSSVHCFAFISFFFFFATYSGSSLPGSLPFGWVFAAGFRSPLKVGTTRASQKFLMVCIMSPGKSQIMHHKNRTDSGHQRSMPVVFTGALESGPSQSSLASAWMQDCMCLRTAGGPSWRPPRRGSPWRSHLFQQTRKDMKRYVNR